MSFGRCFVLTILSLLGISLNACQSGVVKDVAEALHAAKNGYVLEPSGELAKQIVAKNRTKSVLIEFSTTWCVACKLVQKPLDQMALANSDTSLIVRLDVTNDPKTLQDFGMTAIFPGFLLISPGLDLPIQRYGTGALEVLAAWLGNPYAE